LRQVRDATKVCSFSKRNDSILMWSHYANYHKGFCVEYEIDPLPPDHFLRQNLYPVIYSSSLYDLTGWSTSLFSSPREQFNPSLVLLAMLHKYRDWHYEKEWRLILTEPRLTRDRPLQVPRPSRVFLGSRMEEGQKCELTQICATKSVEVWQMGRSLDAFQLKAKRTA
jgi:hypothetical protein